MKDLRIDTVHCEPRSHMCPVSQRSGQKDNPVARCERGGMKEAEC
jgi:hypothetical protein